MANPRGITVQSVARAIDIIEQLSISDQPLGITELAQATLLNKSTIYGLINTLCTYGFIEQSPVDKKYRLGLRLFELGKLVEMRLDIRQEAAEHCRQLADKYQTTVHLATHVEGEIIYVDKIENSSSIVFYSRPGKRAPMYCTGVGKAMLAFLPDSYAEAYVYSRGLKSFTKNTICDKEDLKRSLALVRQEGYATDNEEVEPGLMCLAAPIFDSDGQPIAALSMSFFVGRLDLFDKAEAIADLKAHTGLISRRFGYSR